MLFLYSNSVVVLRKAELDSAPTLVQADAFGIVKGSNCPTLSC